MKRRSFVMGVGAAAAWPLMARAQSATPRVAVLMATREADPEGQARLQPFLQELKRLGWIDGANLRLDIRWADGSPDRARELVREFVALAPDVIVTNGTTSALELKRATTSIPVVFVMVNEPVAQGLIASIARPGGNITGFTMVDFSLVGKCVEMLKAIAPETSRVGLMFNPKSYPYYDVYLKAFQAEAKSPVEMVRAAVGSPEDIDTAIAAMAAQPGGGIVIPPDPFTVAHRSIIRAGLERHRLPHIFALRQFVTEGGLMSYGPDTADIFRRSVAYVDRILKGAKPGELPAQAPIKFELAINLKTAKALGLTTPPTLLAIADEVIE